MKKDEEVLRGELGSGAAVLTLQCARGIEAACRTRSGRYMSRKPDPKGRAQKKEVIVGDRR